MSFKTLFVALASLSVIACGDGGGSDGGNDRKTSISPSSYVEGEFKSSLDTNWTFFKENQDYSDLASCRFDNTERYYESEHVIVLGSSKLPEEDFKWGATLGEKALKNALFNFKISYNDYLEQKSGITAAAATQLLNHLSSVVDFYSPDEAIVGINNLRPLFEKYFNGVNGAVDWALIENDLVNDTIVESGNYKFPITFNNALQSLTKANQVAFYNEFISIIDNYLGFSENITIQNPEKMIVCLDPKRTDIGWGEGKRSGFEVSSLSGTQRSDDIQIATHEAIHHLQIVFTDPISGSIGLERWFAEGQAVAMSGMSVTHGNHGRHTLNVKNFNDISSVYSDSSLEYRDYGQAYNWFSKKFGEDSYKSMFSDIRNNSDKEVYDFSSQRYRAFEEAFNNLEEMSDQCSYDCGFTLEEYRQDYPNQNK